MPVSLSTRSAHTTATAAGINADLDAIEAYTAAIPVGDLADGTSTQIIVCNSSGVPTYRTPSGAVAVSATGAFSLVTDANAPADANLTTSGVTLAAVNLAQGTYLVIGKAYGDGVTGVGWQLSLMQDSTELDRCKASLSSGAFGEAPATVMAIATVGSGSPPDTLWLKGSAPANVGAGRWPRIIALRTA